MQENQTLAVQVWIDEQEKLVSCHEIPGGSSPARTHFRRLS